MLKRWKFNYQELVKVLSNLKDYTKQSVLKVVNNSLIQAYLTQSSCQRLPGPIFQTPTPLLFQNFWTRIWVQVQQFFKFGNRTPVQTLVTTINATQIYLCFYLKKWPHRLPLIPTLKLTPGPGPFFSRIFDSGSVFWSERKTQNPAGVYSGTRIHGHLWDVLQMHHLAFC